MNETLLPIEEKLANIPDNPGCYIYKDRNAKILYVGKAKNLKKRVLSYFSRTIDHTPRIEQMITKIHDVEFHIVDTELEALVLEANLIKKYRPKYNVLMKDDKSYTWLKITTTEDFPKVIRIRDQDKKDDENIYFGPYPDSRSVLIIMQLLRKIFPFRTCDYEIEDEEPVRRSRLCLYYHIGLCPGPCDKLIEKVVYRKQIQQLIRFLRGDNKMIIEELKKQMLAAANNEAFEEAEILKQKINAILYVTQKISITTKVDETLLASTRTKQISSGLDELFYQTNAISINNYRMECFDISNTQGTNPVGSMVVFENGIAKKSDYRKFKIQSLDTPNDFAMMEEMLQRRFKYIATLQEQKKETQDKSFQSVPDLIIIDGGKGQLSTAYNTMQFFGILIPIVGLAKREELLFFPNNPIPLKLKRDSSALYLVQRIRDEAHRFGITFHRSLRSKRAFQSKIDYIPGIGPKTRQKLLAIYPSFFDIQNASDKDLLQIINKDVLHHIRNAKKNK